jgi:hypothetical protein
LLPAISNVLSVEMLRDGGSLSAVFKGTNGSEYRLMFQIETEREESGPFVRKGYARPVVFESVSFLGETTREWRAMNEVGISWDHARALLAQMRGHAISGSDLKWLEAMEEVASTSGQLPAGIGP